MEQLPRGAQFQRSKMLWEIALGIAGDPSIPYYGNRDIAITIGNGSGKHFKPWLTLSPGSPDLAHAVAAGELDGAFVNPSALLTQAYRGVGLFSEPLPVRILAVYPSWDRFMVLVNPKSGITSLAQIKEKQLPVRISIREDVTHSTRVLIDQFLPMYGFRLKDVEAWGGGFQLNGGPADRRRLDAITEGTVDLIFDEGIGSWGHHALEHGMKPLALEEDVVRRLETMGWQRAVLPKSRFPELEADAMGIDFSGWPLYTRESLPEEDAYKICAAIGARVEEMPWSQGDTREGAYEVSELAGDTEAAPREVPLHPGAIKYYREQGFQVA
jgi:TRAP-type uncharacterized transport system substrate-binding protein